MNVDKFVKKIRWLLTASSTIEQFPDAFIIVDSFGYIVRGNKKACSTFGIVGERLTNVDNFLVDGLDPIQESLKYKKPVMTKARVFNEEFYVELNVSKKEQEYYIILRDVSKYITDVVLDEKIRRFNGEKNSMIAKIEDDIKSPLNSIIGFSQGLIDGIAGELSPKQEKYVKIVNSNANDIYKFLDKFIEFSKVESLSYDGEIKKIDVVEAFKNVLKNYENIINSKHIDFNYSYGTLEQRFVKTDANAFESVLKNIFDVSLSTMESGSLSVNFGYPDDEDMLFFGIDDNNKYIKISIKDTGAGFDKDEMDCLCDPYTQITKGRKNFLRALQLGIASIMVKRMYGYINISSEFMHGALYNIIVPVEKEYYE